MPGPNSAPNGDRRLVVGYGYNLIYIEKLERYVVAREYFAKHGRLYTGKTENKT